MQRFDIVYKNLKAGDMGIKITKRPDVPSPQLNYEFITIPGRDGALLQTDGTYGNIEIPIEMNFIIPPNMWWKQFQKVKQWLSGGGNLFFSDDMSTFRKCLAVSIDTIYRNVIEAGEFTVNFLCEPYSYLASGTIPTTELSLLNPYSISKPSYKITGDGMCTLTVNGNKMTANVGQNLTIDTDLMIAYRQDGTLQNTAVTGNYNDLYLQEGENTISITSGFNLQTIPNWRVL